jgi:CRISPR-associated protein Csb3
MSICVNVNLQNPGQFFACCGLLEIADRLWNGAEGWFEERAFCMAADGTLEELLVRLAMDPPQELTELENGLVVKRTCKNVP